MRHSGRSQRNTFWNLINGTRKIDLRQLQVGTNLKIRYGP